MILTAILAWNVSNMEISFLVPFDLVIPKILSGINLQWNFISVINHLDAQHFCFTISLFHASTCIEHMCSKHVEAWNKFIIKQNFCESSWLITEINSIRNLKTRYCVRSVLDNVGNWYQRRDLLQHKVTKNVFL